LLLCGEAMTLSASLHGESRLSEPKVIPAAQAPVEKLLYDKRAAAFALSVSVRTIENMLANKQLSRRLCGRKVLIPAADIRRIAKLEQLQDAAPIGHD